MGTREIRVVHGDAEFRLLAPRSSDALIDDAAFAADERLPYWADLWPSSVALMRWVLDMAAPPRCAIELGCGLGLVALALQRRGTQVTATDYEADALRFVQINAAQDACAEAAAATIETRLLDWRSADLPEPAELVVGADLLYEARNVVTERLKTGHRWAPQNRPAPTPAFYPGQGSRRKSRRLSPPRQPGP